MLPQDDDAPILTEADAEVLDVLSGRLPLVVEALQSPGAVDPERAAVVWPAVAASEQAQQQHDAGAARSAALQAAGIAVDCAVAARGALPGLLEHVLRTVQLTSPGLDGACSSAISRAFVDRDDLTRADPGEDPLQWLWHMQHGLERRPTLLPPLPQALEQWSGALDKAVRTAHRRLHHLADGSTHPHWSLNPYYGQYAVEWADALDAFVEHEAGPTLAPAAGGYRLEVLERHADRVDEALLLGRSLAATGSTWLWERGALVLMKHKRDDDALALVEELLDGDDVHPGFRYDLEKRKARLMKRRTPTTARAKSATRRAQQSAPAEPGTHDRHPLAEQLVRDVEEAPDGDELRETYSSATAPEIARYVERAAELSDASFEAAVRRIEDARAEEAVAWQWAAHALAERWDTAPARQWRLFELDNSVVNGALIERLDLPLPLYRAILRRPAHTGLGRTKRPVLHERVAFRAARARGWAATTVEEAPGAVLRKVARRRAVELGRWHVLRLLERCAEDLSRSSADVLDDLAHGLRDSEDAELRAVVEQAQAVAGDRSRPLSDLVALAATTRTSWGAPQRPVEHDTDEPPDDDWLTWVRRTPNNRGLLLRASLPWDALAQAQRAQPLPHDVVARLLVRADVPAVFVAELLDRGPYERELRNALREGSSVLAEVTLHALRAAGRSAAPFLDSVGTLTLIPIEELLRESDDPRWPLRLLRMVGHWFDGLPGWERPLLLPSKTSQVERWLVDAVQAGILGEDVVLREVWPRASLLRVLSEGGRTEQEVDAATAEIAEATLHEHDDDPHEPCGVSFVRRQWRTWGQSLSELLEVADRVEQLGESDDQALAAWRVGALSENASAVAALPDAEDVDPS